MAPSGVSPGSAGPGETPSAGVSSVVSRTWKLVFMMDGPDIIDEPVPYSGLASTAAISSISCSTILISPVNPLAFNAQVIRSLPPSGKAACIPPEWYQGLHYHPRG